MAFAPHYSEVNEWLERAGIDNKRACRVIIDINVNCLVKVYIEEYGSEAMFEVKPPDLSGCEITVLPKAKAVT